MYYVYNEYKKYTLNSGYSKAKPKTWKKKIFFFFYI